MCLKRRLIKLLYLCKQAVVLKGVVGLFGLVTHPQMHKLRAQAHHLGNAADKVVGHLVAKTHPLGHMLVERNRALLAPRALALFELHLVVLLRIGTRRLAAHLHRGIGRLFARGRYFRCDSDRCGGRSFERTCHRPDGDHDGYPRSGYQLYYLAFLTSRYPGLDPGSYLALIPPLHIKLICNLFPNKITEVYCYFKRKTLLLHPKSITR